MMKQSEFVRWLKARGVLIVDGGKHLKLYHEGRQSTLPRHPSKELKTGLIQAIKKQLNLSDNHVQSQRGLTRRSMHYPARFEPAEEGGFVVTFRDIPEAITQGDNKEEAVEMARDALRTAMEFYLEDKRPIPLPSAMQPGEELVELYPGSSVLAS